ncbi:MAG: NADH-quinone oxidoreductase subunit L [Armatimonadetes bacterium]|nr:NADH-quinone oxidoreductase subunit L [Armatimonadota bacterium]
MPSDLNMVWLVPLFPLIGFLFCALAGGYLVRTMGDMGKRIVGAFASIAVLASFAVSVLLYQQVSHGEGHVSTLFDWIKVASVHIPFEFVVDPLSVLMCLIVTGVGGLIHVYATGYMAEDEDYPRFFTYFNLFIVFMLTLVLANNFVVMFVGWEGVGLCSYLLIGFWYRNKEWKYNTDSANKAFIVNRIGDWAFMIGMFLVFVTFGTFGFGHIAEEAPGKLEPNSTLAMAIALCLFIGAAGKSAQLPLYFWLPDAMAGPTPVSALIHAATMVTAGVYMVSRNHVLFEMAPDAMVIVAIVGAATAVFAATIALAQTDIKKVMAYSTVSQLGYMFLACGIGAFWVAMFHVTTHAFFKALLFLGSGSVIMAMHHEQDMRRMGGLRKYLPITFGTMLVALFAISGIFPFAGFWSKDEILAFTYVSGITELNRVLFAIGLGTAALTTIYMTRMMTLTFGTKPRWEEHGDHSHDDHGHHHGKPKEQKPVIWLPLILLAIPSLLFGAGMLMPGKHDFEHFLEPVTHASVLSKDQLGELAHDLANTLAIVSVAVALAAMFIGWGIYRKGFSKAQESLSGIWGWMHRQWGYDRLMSFLGIRVGGLIGAFFKRVIDESIIDRLFVNGAGFLAKQGGSLLRLAQTGYVRNYALTMLTGAILLIAVAFYFGMR